MRQPALLVEYPDRDLVAEFEQARQERRERKNEAQRRRRRKLAAERAIERLSTSIFDLYLETATNRNLLPGR